MHVVIPVKRMRLAKRRLSACLAPPEREALARAMLADLLERLAAVAGVERVVLVSDEPRLPPPPPGLRVERFAGGGAGLNAELAAALAALASRGARQVLVLHADLPLAAARDLQALVDAGRAASAPCVVLVPDRHRRGTNAMLLAPPDALAPRFGAGSLARHARAARRRGVEPRVMTLETLGLDVDAPADLAAALAAAGTRRGDDAPFGRALSLIRAGRARLPVADSDGADAP